MNGTDVLLYVNTGTDLSPVWTAVGSQRDVSFEKTTSPIDMSSKDSRWGRVEAGRAGATLSLEFLYVPDHTAYVALDTAHDNGDLILVRRYELGVPLKQAYALITSLGEAAPDQEEVVVSMEMTIDGAWSDVGS